MLILSATFDVSLLSNARGLVPTGIIIPDNAHTIRSPNIQILTKLYQTTLDITGNLVYYLK